MTIKKQTESHWYRKKKPHEERWWNGWVYIESPSTWILLLYKFVLQLRVK